MPILSREQITEIEVEMGDLAEENTALKEENTALHAEVLRLRERLKTD